MAVSRWLFWFVCSFILGLHIRTGIPPVAGLPAVAAGIVAACAGRRRAARLLLLPGLFLAAGSWKLAGQEGGLQEPPRAGVQSGLVERVTPGGIVLATADGRIWVEGKSLSGEAMEGDSAVVLGSPRRGGFGALCHDLATPPGLPAAMRRGAASMLARRVPSRPASALAASLLTGDRSRLPRSVRDLFRETGVSHLLAVSGFHVGMAALLVYAVLGIAGRRRGGAASAVAGTVAAAAYALFTGARPPAVRASVMVSAAAVFAFGGIRIDPLSLWAVAALFVMALFPGAWADTGVRMSFVSVLAIISLHRRYRGRAAGLLAGLHAGVAATLALSPLLLSCYGEVAPVSPVATVLSTPLMAATMLSGALTLIPAGWQPFARLCEWFVFLWLGMLERMRLPPVRVHGAGWLAAWLSVMLLFWLVVRRGEFPARFGRFRGPSGSCPAGR